MQTVFFEPFTMRTISRYVALLMIPAGLFGCKTDVQNTSGDGIAMFRNDSVHSGFSGTVALPGKPSIDWTFATGGPINATPVIVDKKILFGSSDGFFYCLQQNSGKLIWKYKTDGRIQSSAAADDNSLVFFLSYDGNFYALNINDGSLKWKYYAGEKQFSAPGIHGRTPKDSVYADDWDFFQSSPVIRNDIVYFGSGSGYLFALNKKSGDEVWKFKTGGIIHASPAIADGRIFFGSFDTYFYALDANSGKELWKFKTGIDTVNYNQTGMQGSPVIKGATVYFGCRDSYMYALDAATGSMQWRCYNKGSWVSSCPVICGDTLFYTTGDASSLVALNRHTGKEVYKAESKGWIFSSPAIAGDNIYYGNLNGFITAHDRSSGKIRWYFQLPPSQKDEYKILQSDSTVNSSVVFNKENQKRLGKSAIEMFYAIGSIHSSPIVNNGRMYFGAGDGNFYSLK